MLKNKIKNFSVVFLISTFFVSISANAGSCKAAAKALTSAKDAENRACKAAAKSRVNQTLDEMKNAQKRCDQSRKRSEKAHKKVQNC
jgi:hypothetical protein